MIQRFYFFIFYGAYNLLLVLACVIGLLGSRKIRKRFRDSCSQGIAKKEGTRVWMHVSSLGEFEQGITILESLKKRYPNMRSVVTFFSSSGFEVAQKSKVPDAIMYLPPDVPWVMSGFVRDLDADLVILVKHDFWVNMIRSCTSRGIPILLISGKFLADNGIFRVGKALFVPLLKQFDHFFVQDESSKRVLEDQGVNQVTVTGDTRVDRVIGICERGVQYPLLDRYCSGDVMVLGSVWPEDISHLKPLILELQAILQFIIVPHDWTGISKDLHRQFPGSSLYSDLEDAESKGRILILDRGGMLSSVYRYAKFAYVGGGFRGALHNLLEPAVYKIPVFFGRHPRNRKFCEAAGLSQTGGGLEVGDGKEMGRILKKMEDPECYRRHAQAAGQYIENNAGATDLVCDELGKYLSGAREKSSSRQGGAGAQRVRVSGSQ